MSCQCPQGNTAEKYRVKTGRTLDGTSVLLQLSLDDQNKNYKDSN